MQTVLEAKKRSPADEYYHLYPRRIPAAPRLHDIAQRLVQHGTTAQSLLTVANVYFELAQHPQLGPRAQQRSGIKLDRLIHREHLDDRPQVSGRRAGLMEAHLPILKYGWTDTAREVTKRGITKLILWDAQKAESCGSGTRGERGNMKGESLELLTDLLLGYTGLDGISAMTSSARQDGYPNLIEGKAYRWDVTAVSNGATIPAGEYRIQVKSDDSSMDGYHPEIARVNGPSTLGVYAQEWGAITDLCMQAASTSIGGVASGDIVHVQERLLERLTLAGPVVVLP